MKFETNSGIDLPKIIKQMGPGLIGLELGVWYGNNAGFLLQECINISKLYGIDPYLPYQDWNRFITETDIKQIRNEAFNNLRVFKNRFELYEMDASSAVKKFKDSTLDFIFIDGDHSFEKCFEDLNNYYSKVKKGGLFSGHDFTLMGVNTALKKFRTENNIKGNFKVIPNDVWYWIKD